MVEHMATGFIVQSAPLNILSGRCDMAYSSRNLAVRGVFSGKTSDITDALEILARIIARKTPESCASDTREFQEHADKRLAKEQAE